MSDKESAVYDDLHRLAEWFDDPNASPAIALGYKTPGMMLREVASALKQAVEHKPTQEGTT